MRIPDAGAASGPADTRTGAILTVDLAAIVANYRVLCERLGNTRCAGVVKADAYGLGARKVAPALWYAGCRSFFVATLDEGLELRSCLPEGEIFVLHGDVLGSAGEFVEHRLIPVLNSLEEISAWTRAASDRGSALPAAIHIDSGMSRLGLPPGELKVLLAEPDRLDGIDLKLVMSHLACSEDDSHPQNAQQLGAFRNAVARLRPAATRLSLANSSGIFLGREYHFDLVRPGAALYGLNPRPAHPNPLRQVVRLQGKILQLREIDTGTPVGYGATHRSARPARLATIGLGYADGYFRSLGNRGIAVAGGKRVPVVGRVSMDLLTLDVSEVPQTSLRLGDYVDLIGPEITVDEVAERAGTIGYEILTSLRHRYARRYLPAETAT